MEPGPFPFTRVTGVKVRDDKRAHNLSLSETSILLFGDRRSWNSDVPITHMIRAADVPEASPAPQGAGVGKIYVTTPRGWLKGQGSCCCHIRASAEFRKASTAPVVFTADYSRIIRRAPTELRGSWAQDTFLF